MTGTESDEKQPSRRAIHQETGIVVDRYSERLREHLVRLYGEPVATRTLPRLVARLRRFTREHPVPSSRPEVLFDETDVLLSCYGDQIREPDEAPLATLRSFLAKHVGPAVSGLHLTPHYPSTSDDGFAVSDFASVDPALGDWGHVGELAADHRLMLDAVVNHTSASHAWFASWLRGDPAYADYYHDLDPSTDLHDVTRPRTTPLLTPFDDDTGRRRWVWTTFSSDQVDLNYANPEVLLAATDVLLDYLGRGARMLRLDAVGFLWKQPGTPSIHLPQTHEIVRLWRTVVDAVAPGTLLVTETNVPHHENVGYLGSGFDEAHLVYQFALPPLTLAAFHHGDSGRLRDWASGLATPSDSTTYLNFLASHDGIGLRPVEGMLSLAEIDELCAAVRRRGGRVSYRTTPDGERPYEINAVYLDALGQGSEPAHREVARFLAAHAILLAFAGVPMLYFHSLFGSRNWAEGVDQTGQARTINRQRLSRADLETQLADPTTVRRQVLDGLLARIVARAKEPAFHPNAAQSVVPSGPEHVVLQRTAASDRASVVCVHDVSGRPGRFRGRATDPLPGGTTLVDLGDGSEHRTEPDGTVDVDVPPYGVRWLRTR